MDDFAPLLAATVIPRRAPGGFGFQGAVMKKSKGKSKRSLHKAAKPGAFFKGVGKSAKRYGGKCK